MHTRASTSNPSCSVMGDSIGGDRLIGTKLTCMSDRIADDIGEVMIMRGICGGGDDEWNGQRQGMLRQ